MLMTWRSNCDRRPVFLIAVVLGLALCRVLAAQLALFNIRGTATDPTRAVTIIPSSGRGHRCARAT
jgi:hypothetical protein